MFLLRFIGKVLNQILDGIMWLFSAAWILSLVAAGIIVPICIVIIIIRHFTTWGWIVPVSALIGYGVYHEGKAAGKREASGQK